jgi:hypothetical protein
VVKAKIDIPPTAQQPEQFAPAVSPSPPSTVAEITDDNAMATFPVNPLMFLPDGMKVDQGPANTKVRSDLVVPALAPLQHDKVLIVDTSRFILIQHREQMREDVRDWLVTKGYIVRYVDDHPFGLGVFTLPDTLTVDVFK